jgi:small multidrug resistance pump
MPRTVCIGWAVADRGVGIRAGVFFLLSQALRSMSVGVAYAIWSGLGTVLIALMGKLLYKQGLDTAAILGMSLIIVGVLVMNLFSKSIAR